MIAGVTPLLAAGMGMQAPELGFDEDRFRAPGSKLAPGSIELATMARRAGQTDLLCRRADGTLPGPLLSEQRSCCRDRDRPRADAARGLRYAVAGDFGTPINPRPAEKRCMAG
ncbi:hypothetical protein [Rhodovulum sp. YEN HP10]|uniref:hypothetical protein n=1 Tax=Rhodovulum sp. HP10 TaxID=3387397 RepID=UPI0039E1EA66